MRHEDADLSVSWDPYTGVVRGERIGQSVSVDALLDACGFRRDEVVLTKDVETSCWPTSMKLRTRDEEGRVVSEEPAQTWNHRTAVWFQPVREEVISRRWRDQLLEDIRSDIHEWTPPPVAVLDEDGAVVELDLFDAHFQMLAWAQETGEDHDLDIITDRYLHCASILAARAAKHFTVRKWLLIVGQDLFHTDKYDDGKIATTARGTPQDVDTRLAKAARRVRMVLTRIIRHLRETAPVDVLVVPGNHDTERAWWMGEILDATFEADEHVVIDNRPLSRKYVRIGNSLIGFSHGHNEKHKDLRDYMTQEAKHDWAETTFREWHVGHFHHEHVLDERGVVVRQMPSLAGTDKWHYDSGYVHSVRGGRAIVWSMEDGPIAVFQQHYPAADSVKITQPALRV